MLGTTFMNLAIALALGLAGRCPRGTSHIILRVADYEGPSSGWAVPAAFTVRAM